LQFLRTQKGRKIGRKTGEWTAFRHFLSFFPSCALVALVVKFLFQIFIVNKVRGGRKESVVPLTLDFDSKGRAILGPSHLFPLVLVF
jgi:hypothetical protein